MDASTSRRPCICIVIVRKQGLPKKPQISHLVRLWLHPAQGDGELPSFRVVATGSERSACPFEQPSLYPFSLVVVMSAQVQPLG